MTNNRSCSKCKSATVVFDSDSSSWVCNICGTVQDSSHFVSHLDVYTENLGPSVQFGRSAPTVSVWFGGQHIFIKGDFSYKDRKEFGARRTIEDISSRLQLSTSRVNDVKHLVEKITEGEWGAGTWFPILVGACAYAVCRKNQLPVTLKEVAASISTDVHELGRMYIRVREFLELDLPETNMVKILERAVQNSQTFKNVPRGKLDIVLSHGLFLLQCSTKWFLTTGRHPLPMVAALIVFAAEINGVIVSLDDIAKELSACKITSKERFKELQDCLVKVAKALPWGGDVTRKNLVHHAPFIIQFMQIKSKIKPKITPEESIPERLLQNVDFSDNVKAALDELLQLPSESSAYQCLVPTDSQSQPNRMNNLGGVSKSPLPPIPPHVSDSDSEKLKLSVECLRDAYRKFQEKDAVKFLLENTSETICGVKRQRTDTVSVYSEETYSDLSNLTFGRSRKVFPHDLNERDIGLDSCPPSFLLNMDASERRRRKIIAAKTRIQKILFPRGSSLMDDSHVGQGVVENVGGGCNVNTGAKRKHQQPAARNGIDWEDCIIELLLLHQVSEEEIQKGYYGTLLDLHVFGCTHNISNEELASYLRPKEEVALLSLLKQND